MAKKKSFALGKRGQAKLAKHAQKVYSAWSQADFPADGITVDGVHYQPLPLPEFAETQRRAKKQMMDSIMEKYSTAKAGQ